MSCAGIVQHALSAQQQGTSSMAIGPGTIAFTGFNADANDGIAFVVLEAIPAGTTIIFSDRE
jgi:hypothetical protein